ncbi:MAG: carboxypeptidase regulatory-like domain-containing protein, partial [Acidobacteria bacterium]|nr:carboxypeptidase regulatory-like domain-containing protein [Acidobacteriota bacterium]
PAAAPAAAPIDPATAGSVTGKISFAGQAPAKVRIRMDATPACTEGNPEPVFADEVVVNNNGTLGNVFVYVKDGLGNRTFPAPAAEVELDQRGCVYHPHVLGLMVGQKLRIKNADKTNHNIHPMPANNREWNVSQPPGGEDMIRDFPRAEVMIPVKCNVHPWMKAYVGVVSSPFFAITGADGSFELKGLPPGDYTIEAWHEKYGTMEQKVTVGPKETKAVDFSFKG